MLGSPGPELGTRAMLHLMRLVDDGKPSRDNSESLYTSFLSHLNLPRTIERPSLSSRVLAVARFPNAHITNTAKHIGTS